LYPFRNKNSLSKQENVRFREAGNCFLQAGTIARKPGAKSLELRAVTSLARLRLREGLGAEALANLQKIYGWFAEGPDTADLITVRCLLEEIENKQGK
jgi:hypothetical protein